MAALDHAFNHEIAVCDPIAAEIQDVLGRKFSWSEDRIRRSMANYLSSSRYILVAGSLHGLCHDPMDDMVIECALAAGAELIVTGDRDLLVLGSYRDTRVVTVREHLDTYAREEQ